MSKEEKQSSTEGFNLLKGSVFGEGPDVVFEGQDQPSQIEVVPPKVEDPKEDHDEASGEPIGKEKEVTKEQSEKKVAKEQEKPTQEVEEEEVSHLAAFAAFLGDKGVVDFNPETFKDSEEGLIELVTESINKGIEEYKSGKPEEVQMFLDFVEAGGNPKRFHEVYYNSVSWEKFEVKDEDSAKIVVEEYLRSRGDDDEEIKEKLEVYEAGGILEKEAKRNLAKLQKEEVDNKTQLLEQQKMYAAEQKKKQKEEYEAFKKDLYSKDEIQGFKLTPTVKDKLWSYMTSYDKKTGMTPLQKHNMENTNAQFLYAYLAMNDWDLTKVTQKEKAKAASELADKLRNFKDGRAKTKSGQSDNFADQNRSNGFSAFKTALQQNQI